MTANPESQDTHGVRQGPHGWANWRAQKEGRPPRQNAKVSRINQVLPTWTENALYSDAYIAGELTLGPYQLLITIPAIQEKVGRLTMPLVLRWYDHLPDPDYSAAAWEPDVSDFHGGEIDDEICSLISLSLGCRMRSGGVIRKFHAGADPLGAPTETDHFPPVLIPPQWQSVLPRIAESRSLAEGEQLLLTYPDVPAEAGVALVRAATQYADALWIADADPRVAWIKLIGALETAANYWKAASNETPEKLLKRHRRKVYKALRDCPKTVREAVAKDLAHTFQAEHKFTKFVLSFDPGPPPTRPKMFAFDWSQLENALGIIYDWRSHDLHGGIPFPPQLCAAPQFDEEGVPLERFPGEAVAGRGGVWKGDELPMYLHLFAYITGGALRRWWASLVGQAAKD